MSSEGPSNVRSPDRTWVLVALILAGALVANSSFRIRIEPVSVPSIRPAAAPETGPLPRDPEGFATDRRPLATPMEPAPVDRSPELLEPPIVEPPPLPREALAEPPPPPPLDSPPLWLDPKLIRAALTPDPPAAIETVPAAEGPAPDLARPPTIADELPALAPLATNPVPTTAPAAAPTPPILDRPPPDPPSLPEAASPPQPAAVVPPPAPAAVDPSPRSDRDPQVEPTACATCGGFHLQPGGSGPYDAMACLDGQCIPGRTPCPPPFPESDSVLASCINNLYQCLCCPDPCYQPQWVPAANASFFADYARPRTVTRVRYDNLENLVRPDRNSFWIMQVNTIHSNKQKITNLRMRLQQAYIYQEAAGARGSFFIEYPYRQINPSYEPTQAGFGDMNFGVKSLLFDCELLQLTFQFRTYAPTGASTLGLGTGHFSLDPSLLGSVKLGPDTYVQGQYGNWIPLGGNSHLAGGVFYWLTSINQVLWYFTPNSPLIATLEFDGWSFENGGYTSAIRQGGTDHYVEKGGGVSYFNIGPGLRQSICNRVDFGGAITWATSDIHWAQPWFRFEVRFLF